MFQMDDNKHEWFLHWNTYQLPWTEIGDHQILTFSNEICILSVKYDDNQMEQQNIDHTPKISGEFGFEWDIDEFLLNKMKQAYNGQIFWSDLFGETEDFALYLAPNGTQGIYEGEVVLGLQALTIPNRQINNLCFEIRRKNGLLPTKSDVIDLFFDELKWVGSTFETIKMKELQTSVAIRFSLGGDPA